LYSIIAGSSDEDAIMIVIDRKVPWIHELAWFIAKLAELGHERAAAITREYLHSMIVAIGDEQETSMMVERQASGDTELAISIALLLGADRELDSSISIKSIVSHLFQINLSVTPHNDEELNLHKPLEPTKRSRRTRSDNETTNEGKNSTTNNQSPSPSRPHSHTNPITNPKPISQSLISR